MPLKNYLLNLFITMTCCLIAACHGFSQKLDYNYLYRTAPTGSGVAVQFSDSLHDIVIELFDWQGTISGCPALSNKDGELIGYFNSRSIYDSLGRKAINGDSMAVGFFQNYIFPTFSEEAGLGNGGNCAFLPIHDSLIYLIYGSAELWTGAPDYKINFIEKGFKLSSYSDGLYLTKIRINATGRLYILPDEKGILLSNNLFQFANIMLCKEANGIDWWVIIPNALNNKASRFKIYQNGEIEYFKEIEFSDNYWRARSDAEFDFSPNGKLLTRIIHRTNTLFKDILEVFEFDRCEGVLTLIGTDSLELPEFFTHSADVKFSANSRFLYVGLGSVILQYDMNKSDFFHHPDTIGIYDGFLFNSRHPLFDQFWRLPNNKILVTGNEFNPFIHYIHNPDLPGDSCDFHQRAIILPEDPIIAPYRASLRRLPQFPPFRMGPLITPCSTDIKEMVKSNILNIFPNPAIDIFSIQCSEPISFVTIYSIDGRPVSSIDLDGWQDHYEFSLTDWTSGVYFVVCQDASRKILGTKKLIKL